MAFRRLLPRNYTRDHLEMRLDNMALEFQRTHDKRIVRKISALSRLLARMSGPLPNRRNYH